MHQPSSAEFQNCICFNLRWVSRQVTQHYDHALASSGLRITQLPLLARLAAGSSTMAELADWLAMDRTTLLRNLQPLMRKGFVVRSTMRRGRATALCLTEAGRKQLDQVHPHWITAQKRVAATLGWRRWKNLLADLEQAGKRLAAR